MSVHATESLIAEVVIAPSLANSPRMIVQSVNPDLETVTTIWFSGNQEAQQLVFPADALDRVEKTVEAVKKPVIVPTIG
jgi:hypothetical protein